MKGAGQTIIGRKLEKVEFIQSYSTFLKGLLLYLIKNLMVPQLQIL